MKFRINESMKPIEIYRLLSAQYDDDFLSRTFAFSWGKLLKDGRETAQTEDHAARPQSLHHAAVVHFVKI